MVEELARGAQQLRTPGHLAMAHDPDPAALGQGLDDIRVHGDTADVLDLATRDRLAVGDQRERLQQRARVLRRAFLPQPRDRSRQRRSHLHAQAAGHFDELDAALAVFRLQLSDRGADVFRRRPVELVEQLADVRHAQRPPGRQQRSFHDVLDLALIHTLKPSCWRRPRRTRVAALAMFRTRPAPHRRSPPAASAARRARAACRRPRPARARSVPRA